MSNVMKFPECWFNGRSISEHAQRTSCEEAAQAVLSWFDTNPKNTTLISPIWVIFSNSVDTGYNIGIIKHMEAIKPTCR